MSSPAPHASCPVRKLDPEASAGGPPLEHVRGDGPERFVVRSFDVARQVLREPEATTQAGFGAEGVLAGSQTPRKVRAGRTRSAMRPPILFLEGAQHRDQRKAAARFFAPKVTEGYRPMMETLAAELVDGIRAERAVDLSRLSMGMAVEVVARVVGLTASSRRGMSRRLSSLFDGDPLAAGSGLAGRLRAVRAGTATARFYWQDVKPAIRARRRKPQEDVISQLLSDGFRDLDVLTECLTYGAAGMVTTREFICVAAWHLFDDPALLARYRAGDREARQALLQETLRLEPVVGHLYRRLREPLVVAVEGVEQTLPAGALVDLDLRAANADGATVGEEPLSLCPARPLPRAVPPALMSFGDGHHRCPGAPIAIMESEIFLSALFAHDVVAEGPPRVAWNPVSQGYDLDRLMVRRAA
ncbi:Cytochrome P450 [Friedmanniella luteola]|uniref:Cytochrome P450 n=1 Tax=Friedmanniella luteola TaxID=546871 RepID=A0A1H1Z5T9_9ACTN|nr:cytochrome P450 [Friedmanniella luteola]SDT28977.1 Cytochrome P450 [Friedmanniella luteola]